MTVDIFLRSVSAKSSLMSGNLGIKKSKYGWGKTRSYQHFPDYFLPLKIQFLEANSYYFRINQEATSARDVIFQ